MNSEPLSESMPMMGNGNTAVTCSRASKTHLAALFRTDRFTVQPVAMSVTVRVKQNSPKLLPPSWPTRSISTKPGTASSHSAQVRIGIWDFSSVPGLVWDRPRGTSFARSPASLRSIVAALMRISRPACSSVSSSSSSRRSSGTRTGSIGASSLPAGARSTAQHLISAGSRSGPVDRRPARPGPDGLQDQGIPQGRPGVVAVPAGQLDQLIEDPGLRLPRCVPIREGLLLRHSLPLGHR